MTGGRVCRVPAAGWGVAVALGFVLAHGEPGRLRVGVTTPSYYSWVARLAADLPVDIVPVLPPGVDLHSYQPRAEDLRRIADLDVLVANGLGHDAFIEPMLRAASRESLPRVDLHKGVPLIPYQRGQSHAHGGAAPGGDGDTASPPAYNPHTFVSISAAIQQIYNLEAALAELLPQHAETLRANARAYVRRLRSLKAAAAGQLSALQSPRLATVHDGYAYLLQELGLSVELVMQPKHGIEPSAQELADVVALLRSRQIALILSEADFPQQYVALLTAETGIPAFGVSHLSIGEYAPQYFEDATGKNLAILVEAVRTAAKGQEGAAK
ncbi:MAG: zinc ABC transporter substrate-binding protein [Candidatus Schekmanbacteria bacterium]|nr:zinc ABC transporter substrate-binding protein [Candidatus Schekmanbacteria bacterium]